MYRISPQSQGSPSLRESKPSMVFRGVSISFFFIAIVVVLVVVVVVVAHVVVAIGVSSGGFWP
jgi:hypothetical protein